MVRLVCLQFGLLIERFEKKKNPWLLHTDGSLKTLDSGHSWNIVPSLANKDSLCTTLGSALIILAFHGMLAKASWTYGQT